MSVIAACRACGAARLVPVLSLGSTPLANALPSREDLARPEATFPLDLVLCEACALVQITETVSPETLFRDYLYFSSFSDTMIEHARVLARRLTSARSLGAGSLVMEIASNDGYLLQHYMALGVPVLGIEPARNVARVAVEARGVPTLVDFFGRELAVRVAAEGHRADVVHANNVLAHVADLGGVVAGIRAVLKDAATSPGLPGVAVVEAPYLRDMIDGTEFDTIYHEHLCYFSLTALDKLFERHDMRIVDVERLAIHGGSLRIFAAPGRGGAAGENVTRLLREEAVLRMGEPAYYAGFAGRVERLKRELRSLLAQLKREGKRVAAYGASAKGSTLLNYVGVGAETIDFVADRSRHKQGRFTPGTHIPIVGPEELSVRNPDYTLLLTWNFADEILHQQAEYRAQGGRFIVPVPDVRVV